MNPERAWELHWARRAARLPDAMGPEVTPTVRFGAELRALRVGRKLSLRALSRELNYGHVTVADWENGRRLPSVEAVEGYEAYFKLPAGTLLEQRRRAAALARDLPPADRPPEPPAENGLPRMGRPEAVCPYKGLEAFEPEDAAWYFGREREAEQALEHVRRTRFAAIVGASGSGKSSFARAGLLPGLTRPVRGAAPRVAVLTPGERPLDALCDALGKAGVSVTPQQRRALPEALEAAIRAIAPAALVVVVDQFEELFTLCHDELERSGFVAALLGVWRDPASAVTVILALRADFYGHVAEYPELAEAIKADSNQTLMGAMTAASLRRAIEQPAILGDVDLQPGLADTIIHDLAGEPGALPLLSHALLETWENRTKRLLTIAGYRDAGGVHQAIATTAERTLQNLSTAELATARAIFLSLAEIGDEAQSDINAWVPTRRRAYLSEHPEFAADTNVLATLATARLVTIDGDSIDIAHEALIRHWPRLRQWINNDRDGLLLHRRVTAAAREWSRQQRDPDALYRGALLATAREWATGHPAALSHLEHEFLNAGQTAAEGELANAKRRARRLRTLATGLALLTAIAGVLAVWALQQRSTAQQQRNAAQRQTTQARALALAASASALRDSRVDVALLLALEANRMSSIPETRGSMLGALVAARTPKSLVILRAHTASVYGVAFSPDRSTLASAGDSSVRVWDVRSRKPLGQPLTGHTGYVYGVAFSPDGSTMASASADATVRLWDVRTRKPLGQPLTGHTASVYGVAFSPDGSTLVSVGADETMRLWDVRTRKALGQPLTGHFDGATSAGVTFSPDGSTLASASTDGTVRLWDVRTREPLGRPLTGHTASVNGVAFNPDGSTLASASTDGTVRLWDVRTREPIGQPLTGHTDAVRGVAFSPDGSTLASASADETVRLWDVRTRKALGQPLTGHTDAVYGVAFSPDGSTLASAGWDTTVRLWDVRTRKPSGRQLAGHFGEVMGVAFSPDGAMLASVGGDETVRLWDVRTRKPIGQRLTGHTDAVNGVAFSPDGSTLASASTDETVRLWDVRTREPIGQPLTDHTSYVLGVAFSPDGSTLASVGADETVRLWDVRSRKPIGQPLRGHASYVYGVAFSPDGSTLASVGADETVRLWDVRTRKPIGQPLRGHTSYVYGVAFSPDGSTLASAGANETMRLWDVRTRKPIGQPLTGHTASVYGVAFSPDGSTLASAAADATLRLWDVRSRKPIGQPLTGHTDAVNGVAFSPDGTSLASASRDMTVQLWDKIVWHSFLALQTNVCRILGNSSLTKSEWAQYGAGAPYHRSC